MRWSAPKIYIIEKFLLISRSITSVFNSESPNLIIFSSLKINTNNSKGNMIKVKFLNANLSMDGVFSTLFLSLTAMPTAFLPMLCPLILSLKKNTQILITVKVLTTISIILESIFKIFNKTDKSKPTKYCITAKTI